MEIWYVDRLENLRTKWNIHHISKSIHYLLYVIISWYICIRRGAHFLTRELWYQKSQYLGYGYLFIFDTMRWNIIIYQCPRYLFQGTNSSCILLLQRTKKNNVPAAQQKGFQLCRLGGASWKMILVDNWICVIVSNELCMKNGIVQADTSLKSSKCGINCHKRTIHWQDQNFW